MTDDPEWVEQVRADLRQHKDADDFRHYKHAAPLCDKHQPNGGTRGQCVICAGEQLQHALSRISYACETPNEMQCSSYDVHMNETAVVAQVESQAERIRVLREALEAVIDDGYLNHGHEGLSQAQLTVTLAWEATK